MGQTPYLVIFQEHFVAGGFVVDVDITGTFLPDMGISIFEVRLHGDPWAPEIDTLREKFQQKTIRLERFEGVARGFVARADQVRRDLKEFFQPNQRAEVSGAHPYR